MDQNLKRLLTTHTDIVSAITKAGGRFVFVGGCVRDALLGVDIKDYDAEVYGLSQRQLEKVLQSLGPVSFVGKSFGVYNLHGAGLEIALPRRDVKISQGHKGFKIIPDPDLSFKEASKRRDLTINSMGYDPVNQELLDPWNGMEDLKNKTLRATDPASFGEDPLRALRVMQFTARFLMRPDPGLVTLCGQQDLSELPSERIWEEFKKLFLKGQKPSWGFMFLKDSGLVKYMPGLREVTGSEWQKLNKAIDKGADSASKDLCHMLVIVGVCTGDDIRASEFLKYLNVPTTLYKKVLAGVDLVNHLPSLKTAYNWRLWAYELYKATFDYKGMLDLTHILLSSDTCKAAQQAAKQFDLTNKHKVMPVIQGQDLINAGFKPGKDFKDILDRCHNYQLETGCMEPQEILNGLLQDALFGRF